MDESFNPYLKWLGIPLQDQPPNHYRLLGIPELIDDTDVIDNAVDRQMGHVRNYATGQHSQLSQQLLNEIAAAKVCLLSPTKKLAYDEQLRQSAARKQIQATPLPVAAVAQAIPKAVPLPQAVPITQSQPVPVLAPVNSNGSTAPPAKHRNKTGLLAAGALGLIVLARIVLWNFAPASTEEPTATEPGSTSPVAAAQPVETRPVETTAVETKAPETASTGTPTGDGVKSVETPPVETAAPVTTAAETPATETPATSPAADDERKVASSLQADSSGDWELWTWDGSRYVDTSAAKINFDRGTLTLTNKTNHKDALLLVYRPFVSEGPFIATIELKGIVHRTGLVSSQRAADAIDALATDDDQWHTMTVERLADRTMLAKRDGHPVNVRYWNSSKSLDGKIAFWLIKDDDLSLRRFEVVSKSSSSSAIPGDNVAQEKKQPVDKAATQESTIDKPDLLQQISLARDAVDGAWTLKDSQLVSPATALHARLSLPVAVPEEYLLEMEVERISGDNMLAVLLVVGGKPAEAYFDYKSKNAFRPISGFIPQERFAKHYGLLFTAGQRKLLQCRVTKGRVEVLLDGKTIIDQQERLEELSLIGQWAGPRLDVITLGTQHSSFRFTKLKLIPLNGSAVVANSPSKTPPVELIPPVAAKMPLPEAPQLEAAQKTFDDVFSKDLSTARTPEQQKTLAKKLLGHVTKEKQSPAEEVVLLRAALAIAIQGGDADTAMAVIDTFNERFEVDALQMKAEALIDLAKPVKTPEEQIYLILAIGQVVHDLVAYDRFESAEPLIKLAQAAALQTKSISLRKELAASSKEFSELQKAYNLAHPSFEILKKTPDDPDANLTVGRYRAFIRRAWTMGLKHLAAGSDETLRNLAAKDLAGTDDPTAQFELGDAWWEAAKAEAQNMQQGARVRAGYWYDQALPKLNGLARQQAAKRLEEIHESDPTGRIERNEWKIWTWDGKRYQDQPSTPLKFAGSELTFNNKIDIGNVALLVFEPFLGDRPFKATMEVKGKWHHIGIIDAERSNQSIVTYNPHLPDWHTVTVERLPDKTIVFTIDGNKADARLWETTKNLEGKIALWVIKGDSCSIRRFQMQTPFSR